MEGSRGTYKHFNGDGDGAVECRDACILSHYNQVNDTIGNLLIIQRADDTYHWKSKKAALAIMTLGMR